MNREKPRLAFRVPCLLSSLLFAMMTANVAAGSGNVDEIIVKSLAASGGTEAWQAVRAARLEGKVEMGDGHEAKIVIEYKRPLRMRIDMELQGMTMVQAFDGEAGWAIAPFSGSHEPRPLDEEILSAMRQQADFEGPLVGYRDKGYEVELVGPATLDDEDVLELRLTSADSPPFSLLLDAESHLVRAQRGTRKMQGNEIHYMLKFDDFRTVQGVTLPHVYEQSAEELPFVQRITIEEVDLEAAIDDARFARPKSGG